MTISIEKFFKLPTSFIKDRQPSFSYIGLTGLVIALAIFMVVETKAQTSECGRVSIANMNWQSAELLANIDKIILEQGFDCEVELISGDTVPSATSMVEKSKPDIAPELWTSALKELITKPIEEGRLVVAGHSLADGGLQGLWVPKYIIDENPGIKTINDALEHPELFPDSEDPSKGALMGCPTGWSCQILTANIFRAYDAESKGFKLVDPGSAAGLDGSIAKAYERKQGWLGYYWSPTSILGKYDMVKLDADVPFSQEEWDRCTSKDYCSDPKPNAYLRAEVITLVTKKIAENNPSVMSYLKNRSWSNNVVSAILAWMSDNQAEGKDGAIYFLKKFPDIWGKWLKKEQFNKVNASIKSL